MALTKSTCLEPEVENRKRLEWELSLAPSDIRSNACYHGPLTRQNAEQLLRENGEFLVRLKSGSKDEEVVLSLRHDDHVLHFVVRRVLLHERTAFECLGFALEDEEFTCLSDLVTCYVGERRCVSRVSSAQMVTPVNRNRPLSDLSVYKNKLTKNSVQLKYETPIGRKDSDVTLLTETVSRIRLKKWSEERPKSRIRSKDFFTYLLPKENRPLDPKTVLKVESVLLDSGARVLANHLLKADLDFFGSHSAILSILLPSGHVLRADLKERHETLKRFVVTSLLTASSAETRVRLLHKWVHVAEEVKGSFGDLLGFGSVVDALSSEWSVSLSDTWSALRREFTSSAFRFETKIKPQLKALEECFESEAPNTCIPFVLTLSQIMEKHARIIPNQHVLKSPQLFDTWFERASPDCGLAQIHSHLQMGSSLFDRASRYARNASLFTEGVHYEDLLLDLFRTEFHRQFLFGWRAAEVDSEEKWTKLDDVLWALVKGQVKGQV